MKKLYTFILLVVFFFNTSSQTIVKPALVKWYTIEQAWELNKQNPRPIFIKVYTDWCSWCKHMTKTTFANKGIANYLNTNFYPVHFNAETLDTIMFNDTLYYNKSKRKRPTHDLAKKLLDNKLSYPSLIFFTPKKKKFVIQSYLKALDFEPLLIYMSEQIYRTSPYDKFDLNYKYTFHNSYKDFLDKLKEDSKIDTSGKIKWYDFNKAIELSKKQKKPFWINIYTDWCHSCKVMKQTSYKNPIIANYINKNFYPVQFNAASQDTIKLNNKTYVSTGKGTPHQLAIQLLNRYLKFPALVILDKNKKIINRYNEYLLTKHLEIISVYIIEKAYKKMTFDKFTKKFKPKIKY